MPDPEIDPTGEFVTTPTELPLTEEDERLRELSQRVVASHNTMIITDDGVPQVVVTPYEEPKSLKQLFADRPLLHRLWRGLQTGGISFLYED